MRGARRARRRTPPRDSAGKWRAGETQRKRREMAPGRGTRLAVQADGAKITTVEGLEQGGKLHPVQEGFTEKHGLQCGFCTPGMLMTTSALLERNKNPSEQQIREAISGNLCRCTGYVNIVKAVQYAAEKMR